MEEKSEISLRTILAEEPPAYNYAEIVINIQYETPNQMGRALSVTDEIKTANNYCLLECIIVIVSYLMLRLPTILNFTY